MVPPFWLDNQTVWFFYTVGEDEEPNDIDHLAEEINPRTSE